MNLKGWPLSYFQRRLNIPINYSQNGYEFIKQSQCGEKCHSVGVHLVGLFKQSLNCVNLAHICICNY